MKELLKSIQTGLTKVEATQDRRLALEDERRELTGKIEKLSAAVAAGDGKLVAQLSIARERLAQLPADFKALEGEREATLSKLEDDVAELYPTLGRAYSREHRRVVEEVTEFLQKFDCNAHMIGEVARQVANEASTVIKFDRMRSVFSGLRISGQRVPEDLTMGRARFAIQELAE